MTLREQFKVMMEFFTRKNFDYAVIGAFALHAYGYNRATQDVDFITRCGYQDEIIEYLESRGFQTLHRSEGYSNHLHSTSPVRIDVVYVDDETAGIIFASTKTMPIFENFELPIVSVEHLIALKLFAIRNDSERKFKELGDIQELFRCVKIDREMAKKYFKQYALEEYYDEVAGNADVE